MLKMIPILLISFLFSLASEAGHSHLPEQAKSASKLFCESGAASHTEDSASDPSFCQFFSSCENLPAAEQVIIDARPILSLLVPQPRLTTYCDLPYDPPENALSIFAS